MTTRRLSSIPILSPAGVLALAVLALSVIAFALTAAAAYASPNVPDPATGFLLNGRQLTPQGAQVTLGNFPTGGAVTADGRFLWTVSAGVGANDIRVVDTARRRVIQIIALPGASGGIALDSRHRRAYVSGVAVSRWWPTQAGLPGAEGNVVLVYGWDAGSGRARYLRTISVAAVPDPEPMQASPATTRSNEWPQKLAVSPGGDRLLVPLNLADYAAVVDLDQADQVRYVKLPSGSYPFGAAVLPGGRLGLVSNEATGTLSVIDLRKGTRVRDITVGPPLSHPEGIAVDAAGRRAYVAISAADEVAVVSLRSWRVTRVLSVGRSAGLGTMPVAVALGPRDTRLFVAESGADEIAVVRLPAARTSPSQAWKMVGRIPTADDPQAVATVAAQGGRAAQLLYVAARGLGVGANLTGPVTTNAFDPIFWAFNPIPPTTDVFAPGSGTTYLAAMVRGHAGLLRMPSDARVRRLAPAATRQVHPRDPQQAPAGTPLRAGGPIKHVFFVVRENRTYDQLLGDLGRGNGDPHLTIFGAKVTPNMHALVTRFPLLDHVYANSEASIQGHYWTSAASVPDYVDRNWVQNYAVRGRPADNGVYAVSFPGNGFLFDQAERQHISYFNYGEIAGNEPDVPDRDRSPALLAEEKRVAAHSDIGPGLQAGGSYPAIGPIGQVTGSDTSDPLDGEIFDCSLPAGAPPVSYSRFDSFRARFEQQLATDSVPTFNYLCMSNDHTRGTQTDFPIPVAMVADNDLGLGQLVDTISHSGIWSSSVIFVVEDDSQDGADHVDAHRIPVAVIGPYAKRGAILHRRYDLMSVLRSMELIMGMRALSLNDALATPMYDAFTSRPLNAEPVDAIPARVDLLTRNTAAAPWAAASNRLPLGEVDSVSQAQLDAILWKSVHGADSAPPPPGPNAEEDE
jgi:DNA-binding beta-propeller fold protein YncE